MIFVFLVWRFGFLSDSMLIRVFLISNFQLAAWGLARLFETEPQRFALISSAFDFEHRVIESVVAAAPDVVLIDIDTDQVRTLGLISTLRKLAPDAKLLLLTRLEDSALQEHAVMSGARGVIDKNTLPTTILTAISKVHQGQLWLDHEATGRIFLRFAQTQNSESAPQLPDRVVSLTAREREVIRLFVKNSSDPGKALAAKMHISESTLRNHLTSIYDKLGVANSHGLMAYALKNGLDQ